MSRPLKTVIVNGSLHRPSGTQVRLDALRDTLNDQLALDMQNIELVSLLPELGAALSTDALPTHAHQAIQAIEQADFLIVGSPIFRAGIPGLLKHLFDLAVPALHSIPARLPRQNTALEAQAA
ncbi:NADPH-dependent FMN reductase [Alcaligenes faecalis]|uniref:NADPH-dependent FMN reductase n=1 Tax=Alcaligenes faecalis TaxID=511 RepID=UPI0018EED712|nr:NAD(P)H-dependent oxidoreductase [Alcaligenes faecalis]